MNIGSVVCKKSRKPFQNKKRTAIIIGWDDIDTPKGQVNAAILKGCVGPVAINRLTDDKDAVLLMEERDKNQSK